jgi:hypothetical protein
MRTRDIERLLRAARDGIAACQTNLLHHGPHEVIERNLRQWLREERCWLAELNRIKTRRKAKAA